MSAAWPRWAQTARIAGAYFFPTESISVVAARLDRLAAENVSVVIADSPLGERYDAWVDDVRFEAVRALMERVVELAHARQLKIVMYHNGLELIAETERNPGREHPEWMQRGLDGRPVLYNDVSNDDQHWLHTGIWAFWAHPCDDGPGSWRSLVLRRIRDMVRTGIDGLWVDQAYLQSSVGVHDDLWPSSDTCSTAAFRAATGLALPRAVDWDDPVFRRWIAWRHTQIVEFLQAELHAARAVNPQICLLSENSCVDTGRSTYVATDAAALLHVPGIATAHEVETIGDRMDQGETGMQAATLDHWLDYRTMMAFARAADRGKPSWILTYGYQERDSAQLAGLTLAEGANFYENKGPQMAASVGSAARTRLFGWIRAHEADFYDVTSAAEVGLIYSPCNRDFEDTVSGEPYDVADSTHFAAYRLAARALHRAHIPVDVVLDTDTASFARYRVLIAPQLSLMSDATAAALQAYSGRLLAVGPIGDNNEWYASRSRPALVRRVHARFRHVSPALVKAADTGLLTSTAPAAVQIGLRQAPDGYRLVVVNTASTPAPAFTVLVRCNRPAAGSASGPSATLALLGQLAQGKEAEAAIPCARIQDGSAQPEAVLKIAVPRGIDTLAIIAVHWK